MNPLHSKPLREAAALLGGVVPLSRYLVVSPPDLDAWLGGRAEAPHEVVGDAIYLVKQLTRAR